MIRAGPGCPYVLSNPDSSISISDYRRSLLSGLKLFNSVDPEAALELLQKSDRTDVAEGDVVLAPDCLNDAVYVVLSGELEVRIGSPDARAISILGPGDCAGEMSIIEERRPSAYVIATESAHLLVIPREYLWELIDVSHDFAKNLLVILSERVRQHNDIFADRLGQMHKFERHATTDALTTLNNRHWMEDMFPREMERCASNRETLSLIMIDVDGFKLFNDRFGHIAGDRVLTLVADALKRHFRPRDFLARFGGDEFTVLLPGVDQHEALQIAERVRLALTGRASGDEDSLVRAPVTISIGVAERVGSEALEALLRKADAALYRAKHAGKNRVSL